MKISSLRELIKRLSERSFSDTAWYIFSLLLTLLFLLVVFSLIGSTGISRYYFNSDMVYDAVIYRDLFIDGTGLKGWHFNPAPNFFPDMLLYFLFMFLSGNNVVIAHFAFSITQYFLVIFLLYLLLKQTAGELALRYATLFNLLFLLFLVIPMLSVRFQLTFHILSISYHIGSFILFLSSLNLLFHYLKKPGRTKLMLLFLFSMLGVANDRLFISQFYFSVFPLFILMINRNHRQLLLKPMITLLVSLVAGFLLFRAVSVIKAIHITNVGGDIIDLNDIVYSWNYFWRYVYEEIICRFPELLIFAITVLSLISALILLARKARDLYAAKEPGEKLIIHYLLLVMALYVLLTAFIPVLSGAFKAPSITRYNVMALYAGLFLPFLVIEGLPAVRRLFARRSKLVIALLSLVFSLFLVWQFIRSDFKENLKGYFTYYPEIACVLDRLKEEHDLKYGIGNYWYAKLPTTFSKKDVRVYSVFGSTLRPYYHSANESWYHPGGKGRHKDPVFNFNVRKTETDSEALKSIFDNRLDTLYMDPDGTYVVIKTPDFIIDRKTRDIILVKRPG